MNFAGSVTWPEYEQAKPRYADNAQFSNFFFWGSRDSDESGSLEKSAKAFPLISFVFCRGTKLLKAASVSSKKKDIFFLAKALREGYIQYML